MRQVLFLGSTFTLAATALLGGCSPFEEPSATSAQYGEEVRAAGTEGAASARDVAMRERPPIVSDAAPPRMGYRYEYAYPKYDVLKSGKDFCAKSSYWGDFCGSCPTGIAAPGAAAIYTAASPTPEVFLACDKVPTSTAGTMTAVAYCCQTPFIYLSGPLPAKSCDDVCAADGLVCAATAPFYDGFGGPVRALTALVRYDLGSRGTLVAGFSGCSVAPAASTYYRGKPAPLKSYTCGCADPRSTLPPPPP